MISQFHLIFDLNVRCYKPSWAINQCEVMCVENEDIINEFAVTKEYQIWQESLLAIIGYAKNEEINDEELITDFIADHINASLELSKALKRIKKKLKKRNEEFQIHELNISKDESV